MTQLSNLKLYRSKMFLSTFKVITYVNLWKFAVFPGSLLHWTSLVVSLELGEQIWCLNMKSIRVKTLPVNPYNLCSGFMD